MRFWLSIYLVVFCLCFSLPVQAAQRAPTLWQSIAPGIEYRQFYLSWPNRVYVARMDRSNPQVTLDSSIAQGKLSGGLETVREMAARYDQSINYWDESWGMRSKVVVAINGSYYNPETGVPTSGQIYSGWYAKRFDELQSVSGFAWTLGRNAFIGGCVTHRPEKQIITYLSTGRTYPFSGVNTPRGEDDLIVYTPQYDATTLTDDAGTEMLVELSRPLMILPTPAMITGTIRDIRQGKGSTPIPFDHVVLSASGAAQDVIRREARIGDQIGISQEIRHLEPDCSQPLSIGWEKTYASIASGYVFLRDGVVQPVGDIGAILRGPRTAIAFNDRYIYFIVVDGRDRFNSLGMSIVEIGLFAKDILAATWGMALDGGGSSTMVINGELKNQPNVDLEEAPAGTIERAVANGMMMVVAMPKEVSRTFKTGDRVVTSADSETLVRLGPGINYFALANMAPGSEGIVVISPNGLNGVLAKGYYWWRVAFGDIVGWVAEERLEPVGAP